MRAYSYMIILIWPLIDCTVAFDTQANSTTNNVTNSNDDICTSTLNPVPIPKNDTIEPEAAYEYTGSALQIFPELEVPCDGIITEWHFVSKSHVIFGFHLVVFRQISNYFHLVGEDYLKAFSTTDPSRNGARVLYRSASPVEVKKGDFIGIVYDDAHSPTDLLTVPTKMFIDVPKDKLDFPPAYVYFMNYTELRISNGGKLDVSVGVRDYRKPALTAYLTKLQTVLTSSPVTTTAAMTVAAGHSAESGEKAAAKASKKRAHKSLRKQRLLAATTATLQMTTTMTAATTQLTVTEDVVNYLPIKTHPYRCLLPPVAMQSCSELGFRAYFDFGKGMCQAFYGCPAATDDSNNFQDVSECQNFCHSPQPAQLTTRKATPSSSRIFPECYQTPTFSNCLYPNLRYYFDSDAQACYTYLGCKPMVQYRAINNFDSLEECSTKCGVTINAYNKDIFFFHNEPASQRAAVMPYLNDAFKINKRRK